MKTYVPSRIAAEKLGFHPNTLRKLADQGRIEHIRISGQRRYNVEKYIRDNKDDNSEESSDKAKICYCRVSSKKQAEDLNRQIHFVQERYPDHQIISDVGSGLNFKRPGLRRVLELAMQENLEEVVVAHKDRLARIGYELIEFIIQKNGGKIMVLSQTESSEEKELAEDIISIITVYSAKYYGKRKYQGKSNKDKTNKIKNKKKKANSSD